MVGGNAKNIGAVSMAADDVTGSPFDAGANRLRSWFHINGVASSTSMGIWSFTVSGDTAYHGAGPGAGTYVVRPCARVLRIVSTDGKNTGATGELICETSTSTWTAGDNVEQAICPYPDVSGFQYGVLAYTHGGTYRSFMNITNGGARTFDTCFIFGNTGALPGDYDVNRWGTCFSVNVACGSFADIRECTAAAITLHSNFGSGDADEGATFYWDSDVASIGPVSDNLALTINTLLNQAPPKGALVFAAPSTTLNADANVALMQWAGYIYMPKVGTATSYLRIDNVTDPTNYERAFYRWTSNVLEIGTEKGGSGTGRDMVLKADNTEVLRILPAGNVKYSNAASFSANGSVATVLGSVGPAGSNTTVQKWLTFQDNGGVTRYIPCF
jgi:hypothetical protein